jgi:hypothetical protein
LRHAPRCCSFCLRASVWHGRLSLSKMKRPTLPISSSCVAALAVAVCFSTAQPALAQDQTPPPQGVSRGENFSAKPPAALFASDCTGAGCHKSPQGLGKNTGIGGLAGFLREHYTNSRESAAALANYLLKVPAGAEPKEARTPRGGKPATASAPASGGPGGWFESPTAGEAKPAPNEARKPPAGQPPAGQNAAGHTTPPTRASRASVKPEDEPAAATSAAHHPVAEPAEPAAKSEESKPDDASAMPAESPAERPAMSPARPNPTTRAQRRQPAATAAAPSPPPMPEAAPAAPSPPPPKEYDIFD